MATPNHDTAAVLVLELDALGLAALEGGPPVDALARYVVRDPEGIEDVLAVTTGWTRNT
jgi:hypothetical protein